MRQVLNQATQSIVAIAVLSFIGCDANLTTVADADYKARTLSIDTLYIGQPCKLNRSIRVSSGWVPVHCIFRGDNEILEATTNPSLSVKLYDKDGSILLVQSPEFLLKKERSTYLLNSFFKVPRDIKPDSGVLEVFGNDQVLLLKKTFEVK
jgi:hypothetical protein